MYVYRCLFMQETKLLILICETFIEKDCLLQLYQARCQGIWGTLLEERRKIFRRHAQYTHTGTYIMPATRQQKGSMQLKYTLFYRFI